MLVLGTAAALASTGEEDSGGQSLSASGADSDRSSEADDVSLTGCKVDSIGWGEATIRVTNNSSKASNYIIELVFESSDGKTQYGTGMAAVNSLQPGQTANETVSSLSDASPDLKCRVQDVTRYAS
jgi:hypothetical protein